ncbi:hypothetical protein HHI36_009194 [Cryptolaemus montrouzieri]|uniref:Uncharacterized protein n=1 Tax=Cryptolaemus montrouzieri TaxID=559131 RepID=A0ABD2MUU1_9CUCU
MKLIKGQIGSVCWSYPSQYLIEGDESSDFVSVANDFNIYFIDSPADISKCLPQSFIRHESGSESNCESLFLSPVGFEDKVCIVRQISEKNSAGGFGVPCSLLTHIETEITSQLMNIVGLSFCKVMFVERLNRQ